MYTDKGWTLINDLWSETLAELEIKDISKSLGAAAV
jgi:hypothetical protein